MSGADNSASVQPSHSTPGIGGGGVASLRSRVDLPRQQGQPKPIFRGGI
eukprot:CAMPEP_0204197520 /NCGR_PEP_ID=MMETSP0361-20130328/64626_1 /ASSEMBLY_ACC=CAM_ASM_000343 /TAXON_ID=268821 /ORGANISM="Scrippsiella Hangoei, Strain SHTV-5" /LENGTH=48 /DNA_ID= /DNA_START= /DNA_END= /DNA_ORIENTATION=